MADLMTNTTVANEFTDSIENMYLLLALDNQEYAISIKYVVDIINMQPITRVPNCPHFIAGITNLRGKVIPIIDLRLRFGKMSQAYTERNCIIFLEENGATVGLVIDSVSSVTEIDESMISPPPAVSGSFESGFIEGVGRTENGIKLILDCRMVLGDDLIPPTDEFNEMY